MAVMLNPLRCFRRHRRPVPTWPSAAKGFSGWLQISWVVSANRVASCVTKVWVQYRESVLARACDVEYLGGDENQQLGLELILPLVAEEVAKDRDITQKRHLGDVFHAGEFVNTTHHDGLTAVHQDCRGDFTARQF